MIWVYAMIKKKIEYSTKMGERIFLHVKSASLEVEVASHVHKVRLILELHDGLEDQSPAAHPEQTAGVLAVGEHPACGGNTKKRQRREAGMNFSCNFYRLQTYSSVGQVCVCGREAVEE